VNLRVLKKDTFHIYVEKILNRKKGNLSPTGPLKTIPYSGGIIISWIQKK
jgi:hypothetical protein